MADPVPKTQSKSAQVALILIIAGTLIMIWSAIWYLAIRNESVPEWARLHLGCLGFFLTGGALLIIGILVGRIGAAAKPADTASDKPGAPNPGAGVPAAPVPGAGAVAPGLPGQSPAAGAVLPGAAPPGR